MAPASNEPRLSHASGMILQAIAAGYVYGYTIMEATGLPSGTVYPALRRLERDGLIQSEWEDEATADAELRPSRKYHRLTFSGKEALCFCRSRYPLLEKLLPAAEVPSR